MSNQSSSHETLLSRLSDHLHNERYAAATARRCLAVTRQFLRCLDKQQVEVDAAKLANVEHYLQHALRKYRRRHGHSPAYKGWRCLHTNGIHMLLRLVQGRWPPATTPITPTEMFQRDLCGEYSRWMTDFSGLAPDTVRERCSEASRFLHWLGEPAAHEDLAILSVADVDAYTKERARALSRRSIKLTATNIRSFLRWLHTADHIPRDFSTAIIVPSLYAFEGIPCAIRAEDVSKILSVVQEDITPKGIRDYAILILLSKYGVRAGEITNLRLDDVDWRKEVIRIRHSKTGVISYLPLLPDVGEAILRYLQKSRPKTSLREIFIRNRAPYRPFRGGSSLYGLVRCRIEAAGVITRGKRGPHAFRHARAVSLLRGAVPVKEIGDLLGHRSADSTLAYLKLATEDLRTVAMEIPREAKS
jgi:integrase/recombinase XerD